VHLLVPPRATPMSRAARLLTLLVLLVGCAGGEASHPTSGQPTPPTGLPSASPLAVAAAAPSSTPEAASRSRSVNAANRTAKDGHDPRANTRRALPAPAGTGSLNWTALAECESSGNPRAVSRSGRYRGAFQMDADFWRTYGGHQYASRPDLASYAEQLRVAQRGYQARGRAPWPTCGKAL
jgi:hypothetical protein